MEKWKKDYLKGILQDYPKMEDYYLERKENCSSVVKRLINTQIKRPKIKAVNFYLFRPSAD